MDSQDWNTVFMAILTVLFVTLGVTFLGEELYHADESDPALVFDLPEVTTAVAGAAPAGPEPIAALLATADPAAGEGVARKCTACHVFAEGGKNGAGPVLHGVVGREIAGVAGFGYSAALKAYAQENPVWSYEELNGFLWNPRKHVSGTSMGFAGLKKPQERAEMIAYLRSVSPNAPPLPDPAEEAPADGAKDGTDGAATEGEAKPAAVDGAEPVTPAANETGKADAIVVDPDTPGATVAPAGENALGNTQPAENGTTEGSTNVVPSTAAPNTLAPKSANEGATLPVAPDAANPRAGAQSTTDGQQGLTPGQAEKLEDAPSGN